MSGARLGILISGRGSNMVALARACASGAVPAQVALVISNVADAPGLDRARELGLETIVLDHRGMLRADHDVRMSQALARAEVSLVCLAGYMRLLSPEFVKRHAGRIVNIHPSLLPAFPGLDAQEQAIAHGVKVSGCTVHLVDEQLDHGPIVMQEAVPVEEGDTADTLSARILEAEHRTYPAAVARLLAGRWRVDGRRVVRA